MQTKIYSNPEGFYELAREWDELLMRTNKPLLFMRYVYQSIWWQHLGNDQLRLIAVRTDDGKLVGLAPLYLNNDGAGRRQLTFVGCVDVSDYLDLVVDPAYLEPVYEAILDCLAEDEAGWDKLYLCSLPHDSLTHSRLAERTQARGWRTEVKQQDVCPVITLPESWDDYLAGINKKQRHEIRRKMRKIETEATTRWYVVEAEKDLDQAMEDFINLHQKSTRDKEEFWSEALINFFKALAHEIARCGWFKLYFIEVNGEQAAAMLCFDYQGEFLLYNSGYDPEKFAHLSPGNVLTSYTIQHAIELGRKRYDFLRGDEIYKFRFGAEPEPVYDLEVYRS